MLHLNFALELLKGRELKTSRGKFFGFTSYLPSDHPRQPVSQSNRPPSESQRRPLKAMILVADIPQGAQVFESSPAWITGTAYRAPMSYIACEDDFDIIIITAYCLVVPVESILAEKTSGKRLPPVFTITGRCSHTEYWGEKCLIVEAVDRDQQSSIA